MVNQRSQDFALMSLRLRKTFPATLVLGEFDHFLSCQGASHCVVSVRSMVKEEQEQNLTLKPKLLSCIEARQLPPKLIQHVYIRLQVILRVLLCAVPPYLIAHPLLQMHSYQHLFDYHIVWSCRLLVRQRRHCRHSGMSLCVQVG